MPDLAKHVWKFQEGLLCVLLEGITDSPRIHWGASPSSVSIDTDIIVGDSPDAPEAVVMVTHNTADNVGQKKFWRNVNELFELRSAFPRARIGNVSYESGVPAVTAQAMSQLVDLNIDLDQDPNLSLLARTAEEVTHRYLLRANRETVLRVVQRWVANASKPERDALSVLRAWLQSLLRGKAHQPKWLDVVQPCAPMRVGNVLEHSGFRRAIGKLSIISDEDFNQVKIMKTKGVRYEAPHLQLLGIASPRIGGLLRLTDSDIGSISSTIGWDTIAEIRKRARSEMAVINRLEMQSLATGDVLACAAWIKSNWSLVTNPRELAVLLEACFQIPSSVGPPLRVIPEWHWLFDLIVYLIKESRGSRHGFSWSKLAQEIEAEGIIGRNQRLTFAYYAERRRNLTPKVRDLCAKYLSRTLKEEIDPATLTSRAAAIVEMRISGVMERIVGGQEFEPLYWLVEHECKQSGVPFYLDKAVPSFISDLHPSKPGTSKLGFLGGNSPDSCILAVHCRTAHDGAADKRKETCARGRSLRRRLNAGGVRRQLENKLCLVLDGDWAQRDIDLLVASGWTRIYSYSEIKDLVIDAK